MTLHIGITGYIGTDHVADWLSCDKTTLPKGQPNAPLMGVLIGELLKNGHKVSAFTVDSDLYAKGEIVKASGPNFDFYICPQRPRAWRFNKFRLGRGVDGFTYEIGQLAKAIEAARPDIIHAHWTYEFALAALQTHLPHLITCHDAPAVILRFNPYPYRAIRYLMARQVFRKGQNFTTVSDYMVSELQHYTQRPINVVPNPLAAFVLDSGNIRSIPSTKRIGLICNGWDDRKNPKPSLQAFANFYKLNPDAELHTFGHGFGIGEEAQIWCQKSGLTAGIFFHGPTPHKQVIEQLNSFDLLLHPALEESFCVAIAEAMALGLPIVAGKSSGAVPWVVGMSETSQEMCCAVLTDVSDPAAICLALQTAFNQDYPMRSVAGFSRSRQKFAPDVIINNYLSLYRQVLLDKAKP